MSRGDKKFLETSDIFRALIPHFYANMRKKNHFVHCDAVL